MPRKRDNRCNPSTSQRWPTGSEDELPVLIRDRREFETIQDTGETLGQHGQGDELAFIFFHEG